jgi:hypothetical protein
LIELAEVAAVGMDKAVADTVDIACTVVEVVRLVRSVDMAAVDIAYVEGIEVAILVDRLAVVAWCFSSFTGNKAQNRSMGDKTLQL